MIRSCSTITLAEIHSADALLEFAPQWRDLWQRCPDATPFQSPDWLLPWWHCIGEGELRCVAIYEDGQLQGFVPACVQGIGTTEGNSLRLMGQGNSDYLDALLAPRFAETGAELYLEFLHGRMNGCRDCELFPLRCASPLVRSFSPFESDYLRPCDVCPVLTLPAHYEALEGIASAKLLADVEYNRRRLQKLGAVEWERADAENFELIFGALVQLHSARWRERDRAPGIGAFGDERALRFHHQAASAALKAGTLRLFDLRFEGRIVAAYYGFLHRGRAYYYLSGFEPDMQRYSLGSLLVAHAIEEAIREKANEFDFLRGAEPYKYRWGAQNRVSFCRRLAGAQS